MRVRELVLVQAREINDRDGGQYAEYRESPGAVPDFDERNDGRGDADGVHDQGQRRQPLAAMLLIEIRIVAGAE